MWISNIELICGFMVGTEFEHNEYERFMAWILDLGVIRITFVKYDD